MAPPPPGRARRMRRPENPEQPPPVPPAQSIDLHRQQLHIVPGAQLVYAIAKKCFQARDVRAERLDAPRANAVEGAFRDDVAALPVVAAVEQDENGARFDVTERL